MNKFEYTPASRFQYRYAITFLTSVLLIYLVIQIMNLGRQPLSIFLAAINAAILFLANKYYYRLYSTLPFIIIAGKEKLTASNFMFGKKPVEIKYSDIDEISGGVFGYNRKGLIYLHDGAQKITISIHPSIINIDGLIKIIADNVKKEMRDEMTAKLKRWEEK